MTGLTVDDQPARTIDYRIGQCVVVGIDGIGVVTIDFVGIEAIVNDAGCVIARVGNDQVHAAVFISVSQSDSRGLFADRDVLGSGKLIVAATIENTQDIRARQSSGQVRVAVGVEIGDLNVAR